MAKKWIDPKIRAKIYNAFLENCSDCGKCCKEERFAIAWDVNVEGLYRNIKKAKQDPKISINRNGVLTEFKKECGFLVENSCQVYNERPSICQIFPVVPSLEHRIWYLDSTCPPIKRLSSMDINLISFSDITYPISEIESVLNFYPNEVIKRFKDNKEGNLEIELLAGSLRNLENLKTNRNFLYREVSFYRIEGIEDIFLPVSK